MLDDELTRRRRRQRVQQLSRQPLAGRPVLKPHDSTGAGVTLDQAARPFPDATSATSVAEIA